MPLRMQVLWLMVFFVPIYAMNQQLVFTGLKVSQSFAAACAEPRLLHPSHRIGMKWHQ